MFQILRREVFSENAFLWEVSAPDVAAAAQPGHFVMLRLHEGGERIPLTAADFDRQRGTVTVVVQTLGKTTREMRDDYAEGEAFDDFVGPLGLPQHIEPVGHVVLVGGGLGVAPIFPQLRAFKQAGCRTTCIVGFRNKDLVFWADRLAEFSDELIVCADDGSAGRPGFVTAALKGVLDRPDPKDRPDQVVAIGPMPMMHACTDTTRPYGVRTMVSLNTIMVDGTGMCGSCRVTVGGEVKFACVDGCPVSIDIPRFIRHLLVRDVDAAAAAIHESSIFPSVCGRVCPQESQCEAQCVLIKAKMEPVAIGRLERFVGDHARPSAMQAPQREHALGQVAIVGSGPGGLAAAAELLKAGAKVTVYEALHVVGGVLRYGIPSFRLPCDIIEREVQRLREAGVRFETNKVIGKTFALPQLTGKMGFDAVFVAAGAGAPAFLSIPGEFAGQVYSANEFLTRVNLMGGDQFPYRDTPIGLGNSVVVIGAGNTAMDCLRVAKRLGAERVRCVYRRSEAEAPARVEELRHAKEEGIEFSFLHGPEEILLDDEGNVRAIRVQKMALGDADARGRRSPVPLGESVEWPCDTVIYALGTKANPIIGQATPGLALNRWGYIVADDETQATNLPGIFAGGDIVTGGATVILAMSAGRRAARAITAWLHMQPRHWPVTRDDLQAAAAPAPADAPVDPSVDSPAESPADSSLNV